MKHSSMVGGSTAGRILACPASWQSTISLPPSVEITSEYAEEGTHLHHIMNELMEVRQIRPESDLRALAASYIGRHFYDRVFTKAYLDEAVEPALDALAELEQAYGGGFAVLDVERQVRFPGIPGAFGTCDLLLGSASHRMLVDWKFGAGVPVAAIHHDADGGEYINPQLAFYLTAARASLPQLFKPKCKLVGAIIQPRADTGLSHTEIDQKELKFFAQDLETAVIEALGHDPRRTKGEHCRFAPCKVTCPLWTGPLLDLSLLAKATKVVGEIGTSKEPTAYGKYLATAKTLVDAVTVFKTTLDEQLHAYLEEGGIVPGWRLKAKIKNRLWVDDAVVVPALKSIGFTDDEIWQTKLQTFSSVDATAKRRRVNIPDHLRVAPPSNETTIASTSDPAPVVDRAHAVSNFVAALKQLRQSS